MDKKAEGHIKETANEQSSHIGGHFNGGFESKIEKIEMQLEKAQHTLEELRSMKERLEEEKRLNEEKAKLEQEKLTLVEIRDENKKLKTELKSYQSEINALRDVIGSLKDDLAQSAEAFQHKVAKSLKVLEEADSALSKNSLEATRLSQKAVGKSKTLESETEETEEEVSADEEKTDNKKAEAEKPAPAKSIEKEPEETKSVEEEPEPAGIDEDAFTEVETEKTSKEEAKEFKEEVLIEELSEYEKIKEELEEIVHSNIFTHDEEIDPEPPVEEAPVVVEAKPAEQEQAEKTKKKGLFSFLSKNKKNKEETAAETPKAAEATAPAEVPASPETTEPAASTPVVAEANAPKVAETTAATNDASKEAEPAKVEAAPETKETTETETVKEETEDTSKPESAGIVEKDKVETDGKTAENEVESTEAVNEENPAPVVVEDAKPEEKAEEVVAPAKSVEKEKIKKTEKKAKDKKEKTGGGTKLIMRTAVFLLIVCASFAYYRIKNADKLREALTNQVQQAYSKTPESNVPEEFAKKTPEEKYPTAFADVSFEKTIWATHNDSNLGIKIDYPQNTSYRLRPVDSNNLWFLRKNGYLMKIEKKASDATYDEFLADFKTDVQYKVENVTFNGKVAVHLVPNEEIPVPGNYYIVKTGKSILTIWYRTYAPKENPDDEKRIEQMLNSIEFSDSQKAS